MAKEVGGALRYKKKRPTKGTPTRPKNVRRKKYRGQGKP